MIPDFFSDGICIIPCLSVSSLAFLKSELSSRILTSLGAPSTYDLATYHLWWSKYDCNRAFALSAKSRHFQSSTWNQINLIPFLTDFIQRFFPNYVVKVWDEGLGSSAFRLVRPGFEDGYPPSRKSWGPGGKLLSVTIPLIGFSMFESQAFILGSHLLDYPSELPVSRKFTKDERRLVDPSSYKFSYFSVSPGDIIVFHWNTIHSEQIVGRDTTRLALEVRFNIE